MKILITNDDGINAEGLAILVEWAKKLGDIFVVAPKYEQSGKSQAIELKRHIEIKRSDVFSGIPCYSVDSTPADCVRFGLRSLDTDFDMVFSGINRGYNLGTDILYSGTCGAIFEAAANGKNAVAFSTSTKSFECAKKYIDEAYAFITDNGLFRLNPLYNVNIPLCDEYKGIAVTHQGRSYYTDRFVSVGEDMYAVEGDVLYSEPGSVDHDTDAVKAGFTSICPLTTERTALDVYKTINIK